MTEMFSRGKGDYKKEGDHRVANQILREKRNMRKRRKRRKRKINLT